jgi:hypothetical protein
VASLALFRVDQPSLLITSPNLIIINIFKPQRLYISAIIIFPESDGKEYAACSENLMKNS